MASIPLPTQFQKLKRKAVFWALPIAALLAAVLIAVDRSACSIVVYNQTAEIREEVQVGVGETMHRIGTLEPAESRRVSIPPDSGSGAVKMFWAGGSPEDMGEIGFEPGPGRQLVVRLEPGGYVFCAVQESMWNRLERALR